MVKPTTFRDRAQLMVDIADRLLAMKDARGYSDEDARAAALLNCRFTCSSAVFTLNVLSAGEDGRVEEDQFRALIGVRNGLTQNAVDGWGKATRLALLVLFQFQVENLLKNLARELQGAYPSDGFFKVAEGAAQRLPNSQSKLERLYLPALLRNSLHANGIHLGWKKQSYKISIGSDTFELRHGEVVSCAGWHHVAVALNASIDVIEEILDTPEVSSLPDPIMDQYVWEKSTRP